MSIVFYLLYDHGRLVLYQLSPCLIQYVYSTILKKRSCPALRPDVDHGCKISLPALKHGMLPEWWLGELIELGSFSRVDLPSPYQGNKIR
jgi:hypothetical protein